MRLEHKLVLNIPQFALRHDVHALYRSFLIPLGGLCPASYAFRPTILSFLCRIIAIFGPRHLVLFVRPGPSG